jgi:hypothetical protein
MADPTRDVYAQPGIDPNNPPEGVVPMLRVEIYTPAKYTIKPIGDSVF